jgi:hypothetical protein
MAPFFKANFELHTRVVWKKVKSPTPTNRSVAVGFVIRSSAGGI